MIEAPKYLRPERIEAALAHLAGQHCTVLAGGTDLYPAHVESPFTGHVLDVSALAEMRGVALIGDARDGLAVRLGALTTWTDVAQAPLPSAFSALAEAAREVGGLQIQNRATVGGNLCNASPAADGIPPLLAFDARVELRSARGTREVPIADFVLGNRRTALAADELLVAITLPARPAQAVSRFLKLGHRRYLVISIAMVAAALDFEGDRITRCAVAIGACSPVARRLPFVEQAVTGRTRDELAAHALTLIDDAAPGADPLSPLSPIDDVRATAIYRRDAVRTLVARALTELARVTPRAA